MSTIVPRNRVDPTGTKTMRERYAAKLRGAFADLNTSIRQGIIEDDVFGLDIDVLSDPPSKDFRFLSDSRKRERFQEWLDTAIEEDVLTTIDRNNNTYIKSAYTRGIKDANQALRASGVTVPEEDLQAIFNQGVHQSSVKQLYANNYADLEDITQVMSQQIGEELAEGFAQGEGPREMARRITDRVNKIGKTRATVLAQWNVIDTYNTATLNRLERMNVGTVTIIAEYLTAQDDAVCPVCGSLEGETWTIQEARESTWTYEAGVDEPPSLTGEYPVKPPLHGRCRCRVIPRVT